MTDAPQNNRPLTDDEIVNIELAKNRLHEAIGTLHEYPQIKTEAMIAKALTNTVRELLVEAGITTHTDFYNKFTGKIEDKIVIVQDMLGIDPEDDGVTGD